MTTNHYVKFESYQSKNIGATFDFFIIITLYIIMLYNVNTHTKKLMARTQALPLGFEIQALYHMHII